ncbi:hypothetical protein L218DRAFT_1007536 [Marasmius fiardii PR-910]|nr:hypothetical protein L218DRAFT_1007536 [Marasmius fiardii PR-910]
MEVLYGSHHAFIDSLHSSNSEPSSLPHIVTYLGAPSLSLPVLMTIVIIWLCSSGGQSEMCYNMRVMSWLACLRFQSSLQSHSETKNSRTTTNLEFGCWEKPYVWIATIDHLARRIRLCKGWSQSSASGIQRPPAEALAEIFSHLCSASDYTLSIVGKHIDKKDDVDYQELSTPPLTLLQVSHYWRKVAFSCLALWSSIEVGLTGPSISNHKIVLSTYFKNTASRSLDITIRGPYSDLEYDFGENSPTILETIFSQSFQFEAFQIFGDCILRELLAGPKCPLPLLRRFETNGQQGDSRHEESVKVSILANALFDFGWKNDKEKSKDLDALCRVLGITNAAPLDPDLKLRLRSISGMEEGLQAKIWPEDNGAPMGLLYM